MKKNSRKSISSPSTNLSTPGSAKRRPTRQPKLSEGKDRAASVSSSVASSSKAKSQTMPPPPSAAQKQSNTNADTSNPTPWKHPAELPYICREDWSQDLMLEYLCQKSFSVPPRDINTSVSIIQITPKDGSPISLPRRYRVPLMFLAKFQWESLRLVLNASNPVTDWQEYKFDIIHISRLCQHLFQQATEAKAQAGAKGLDKMWRSAMFDRVLTRFYHHWFISREWSVKHFYEEFDEEEYENDVLKYDWIRWALKGHKGFALTKEEIQNGITAERYMRGLGRNADGLWTWNNNPNMTEVSIPAFSPSNGGPPLLSEAVEAITNLTPAHNTIEVKREHLELSRISLASLHANGVSEVGTSTPSNALITNTMDNINPQPEQLMDSVNPTHQPPSQTAGKKRLRDETANTSEQQPKRPRVKQHARKSLGHSAWLKLQRERELQEKLAASESSQLSSEEDKANTKISTSPKNEKKVHALTLKLKRSAPSVVLPPTQRQNLLRRSSPTSLSASTASPSKDKLRILERSPTALKSISAPIAVANPQTATQGLSGATAPLHSFDSQSKIPTTPSTSSSTAISSTVTSVSQPITQDASRPSNLVLQSPVTPLLPEPATSISIISQLHSGAAMNNPSDHDTSLPNTNVDAKTGPVLPPSTPETSSIMDTTMTHLPTPVLTLGTSASPTATIALKPPKTPVPQSDLVESSSSSQTSTNESAEPQTPSQNAKLAMSVSTSLPSSELQSGPKTPPSPQTPASHVTDIVIASKETARRPVVFSRSSESVIARGLLEIAHLSSAVHDTVEVEPEKIVEDRPMANGDGSVPDASVSKVAPVQEEKAMAMSGPPPSLKGPRATATSDMAMLDAGAQCLSADASSATQVSDGVASLDKIAKVNAEFPATPTQAEAHAASGILSMAELIQGPGPRHTSDTPMNTEKQRDNDGMDVDDQANRPTNLPSSEGPLNSDHSVLLMAQGTRAKSLHTILLLRDLLDFLRSPSFNGTPGVSHVDDDVPVKTQTQGRRPSILDARTRHSVLEGEEAMSVDQRLDILAHASVALAKVLFPFRGEELETRIDSLDKRLQQQFDMIWKPEDHRSTEIESHAHISEEKEVQTITIMSTSQGFQTDEEPSALVQSALPKIQCASQAIQTSVDLDEFFLASVGTQTEDTQHPASQPTESKTRPLSPDATMIDLTLPQPAEVDPPEVPKLSPESSERSQPVAKLMMSIMRNMADLLECSTADDATTVKGLKGKDRELDAGDLGLRSVDRYGDSPVISAIINEFKAMKEELRHTQQWSREEFQSMGSLYRTEVESLKGEMRNREQKARAEMDEMRQRHRDEVERLKDSIQLMEKEREKRKAMDEETRMPALEMLELRRRISSLESRSRLDGFTSDVQGSTSQASPVTATTSELPTPRISHLHPLGHLIAPDYEEMSSRSSPRPQGSFVRDTSTPKPGTPMSSDRHSFSFKPPDGAEIEESMPLPIKSQRKLHMMMFPRAPLG